MKAVEAVYYLLANNAGVEAIVGSSPNQRITPDLLPQKPTYPALTYGLVSEDREFTAQAPDPGIVEARVQVTAWAITTQNASGNTSGYAAAMALAEAVRTALQRQSGTFNSIVVQDIFFEARHDHDDYDGQKVIYQVIQDFKVWYTE